MQRPDGRTSQYRLAVVYIGLGERDRAFIALERAVQARSPGVVHLKVSPLFRDLRSSQRFQDLLADIGFTN